MSDIRREQPQRDGRVWVVEVHVLSDGSTVVAQTLCDPELDVEVLYLIRDQYLNAEVARQRDPSVLSARAADLRAEAAELIREADAIIAQIGVGPSDVELKGEPNGPR